VRLVIHQYSADCKLFFQPDLHEEGSTKCHTDRSGAINIMLHSETINGDTSGAEWFLFPESSIPFIFRALQKAGLVDECSPGSEAQCLLQQNFFMDADLRRQIVQLSKGSCWRIEQHPGDAIFIPPRCPHQVSSHQFYVTSFSFGNTDGTF
jgi:hypothetical protein